MGRHCHDRCSSFQKNLTYRIQVQILLAIDTSRGIANIFSKETSKANRLTQNGDKIITHIDSNDQTMTMIIGSPFPVLNIELTFTPYQPIKLTKPSHIDKGLNSIYNIFNTKIFGIRQSTKEKHTYLPPIENKLTD